MNRFKTIGSALLLVPAMALVSTQARAEFKCDAPATHIDRAACAKASESPHALRQYVQRLRSIESLQFSDYVNDAQAQRWAQNEPTRVPAKKAAVQTAVGLPEYTGA